MICSMRLMPSVVTLSTWVSPRWNRPEPCDVAIRPTSAVSGRMSVGPRPSMRTPSSTMRRRTISFVVARTAAASCLTMLAVVATRGEAGQQLGDQLAGGEVGGGVALGLVGDLHRGAQPVGAGLEHGRLLLGRVVVELVERHGSTGPTLSASSRCRAIISLIDALDSSRPWASTDSSTLGAPSA